MILKLLKDYKKETICAPLFKMLEAIFELFVPLVIARMIDEGITGGNRPIVIRGAAWLLLLAVIGLTCSIRAQYYAAKAAIGASTLLRSSLYRKLMGLSFSQIESLGTDTMITRLTSDVNQVQNGINMTLRLFLRSPFIVFGAMIMAFTIDAKAALIFAVTIPALSLVVYGIMVITMPMYKKAQAMLDSLLGTTRENLTGVRVIRAFAMEKEERAVFNDRNEALNSMQKNVGRISALMNPLTFVIVNAATLILLYTGAVRVDEGVISRGSVVALINYMSQILVELIKLANLIVLITRAMACADRIKKVLEIEGDEEELSLQEDPFNESSLSTGAKKGIGIEFRNVGFSYNPGADEQALSDISFSAPPGATVGIIGGTGSGKTTLVNMIPGFFFPTQGEVYIDGTSTTDMPLRQLRSLCGTVLQKPVLFSGTIRENLLWGGSATDEELTEALKTAQAWDFVKNRKGGLDCELHQGGRDLSGGQRQRLSIARAIVSKPPVIILDDSSSALDYATDAALRGALARLHEEYAPTVFIVSQRTASLQHADLIVVLDEGRIAGMGTHDELLAGCDEYREIYDSQAG
ncbi:MAG: ABC transporter ATP-binding protein [Lachnospiraceae bacterium]|nr:ABC transporter ATP-binding protein [Lachnospiraceae bacterium]